MAKSRYHGKKRSRKGGRRKGHGRKAAGKRLARYNKLAARIGKRAAHAQVFGGGKHVGKRRGRKTHRRAVHRSGHVSAARRAAGKRLFARMAARHGGVANYKRILRARLARARRA